MTPDERARLPLTDEKLANLKLRHLSTHPESPDCGVCQALAQARTAIALAAEVATLRRERDEARSFVDEDETLKDAVRENLPECTCDSDGNLGNKVERIEFAGAEIRRLNTAIALRARLAEAERERDRAVVNQVVHGVAEATALAASQAEASDLRALVGAVESAAFGTYLNDIGGRNWFDVRDALLSRAPGTDAALRAFGERLVEDWPCFFCNGRGSVGPYERDTPDGSEVVPKHTCATCGGTGKEPKRKERVAAVLSEGVKS